MKKRNVSIDAKICTPTRIMPGKVWGMKMVMTDNDNWAVEINRIIIRNQGNNRDQERMDINTFQNQRKRKRMWE